MPIFDVIRICRANHENGEGWVVQHTEPSGFKLTALVLGDERLRSFQAFSQFFLGHLGITPRRNKLLPKQLIGMSMN